MVPPALHNYLKESYERSKYYHVSKKFSVITKGEIETIKALPSVSFTDLEVKGFKNATPLKKPMAKGQGGNVGAADRRGVGRFGAQRHKSIVTSRVNMMTPVRGVFRKSRR